GARRRRHDPPRATGALYRRARLGPVIALPRPTRRPGVRAERRRHGGDPGPLGRFGFARGSGSRRTMSDVVVITGASGGIGRATARRFAQDGAKLALLARGRDGLEAAATEVEELGGKALVLPTDVADADAVEAAAQAAESELGPI